MAGLQYNFFPTDFFYPRPKSNAGATDAGQTSSPPIVNRPDGASASAADRPAGLVVHTNGNKSATAVEYKRKKYNHLDG
ncbi:unnamed protein product [Linum trigynum]|uniref:Uncharacterized protein n=1 Tax=Linum trigynum TaxID=586398 RepID=A0AAV2EJQ6_9ROSI